MIAILQLAASGIAADAYRKRAIPTPVWVTHAND
jgi:hypothetical protein